jgi:biopolymer transport protein ExbD
MQAGAEKFHPLNRNDPPPSNAAEGKPMKKLPTVQELRAPNLIPMIDIMFLLLLFFMLGADMGQRKLEDVRLPKADQAKIPQPGEGKDSLTINAHHRLDVICWPYAGREVCRRDDHWKLAVKGKDCTDPQQLAAVLKTETASSRKADVQGRTVSDRVVMIRSDASAPYALAQRAMTVCAEQGIYRIEVGAAKPAVR